MQVFKRQQVEVVITRSTLINQTDNADTEKVEAETKGQLIQKSTGCGTLS